MSQRTKVFKAYGRKSNTHTANIRQHSALNNFHSPERAAASQLSSTDTDSDSEPEPQRHITRPAPVAPEAKALAKPKQVLKREAGQAGGLDKENASSATASPARRGVATLKPQSTNHKLSPSKAASSGKLKVQPRSNGLPLQPKAALSGSTRARARSAFLGVIVEPKPPRPRSTASQLRSTSIVTISDDEELSTAPANQSGSSDQSLVIPSKEDVALSTTFGDLELSDSDGSDIKVLPQKAVGRRPASVVAKPATYGARGTRRVAAPVVDLSSEEESVTVAPVPAPPVKAAATRQPRHTRSASVSKASIFLLPALAPASSRAKAVSGQSKLAFPAVLKPLLSITSAGSPSTGAFDFAEFVSSPPAPLASSPTPWRKIGEASYSEVFSAPSVGGEELVVKIIPISPWAPGKAPKPSASADELPFVSEWQSVEREVAISSLMGGGESRIDGFVPFKG